MVQRGNNSKGAKLPIDRPVHSEQHQQKQAARQVQCLECQCTFCRQGDMKRHKCLVERW